MWHLLPAPCSHCRHSVDCTRCTRARERYRSWVAATSRSCSAALECPWHALLALMPRTHLSTDAIAQLAQASRQTALRSPLGGCGCRGFALRLQLRRLAAAADCSRSPVGTARRRVTVVAPDGCAMSGSQCAGGVGGGGAARCARGAAASSRRVAARRQCARFRAAGPTARCGAWRRRPRA